MTSIREPHPREDHVAERVAESDLVAAAARGDDGAVRELVRLHGPRMFACAERLVDDHALAEEIVQDVLVQLVRRGGSFRQESSVATWLLALTINRARSYRRRAAFRFRGGTRELDATLVDARPGPDVNVESRERREALDAALGTLPVEARELLALRFGSELSYDEIAAVLRCAPGTVASRLHRALRRLGDVLRARGWSQGEP